MTDIFVFFVFGIFIFAYTNYKNRYIIQYIYIYTNRFAKYHIKK